MIINETLAATIRKYKRLVKMQRSDAKKLRNKAAKIKKLGKNSHTNLVNDLLMKAHLLEVEANNYEQWAEQAKSRVIREDRERRI